MHQIKNLCRDAKCHASGVRRMLLPHGALPHLDSAASEPAHAHDGYRVMKRATSTLNDVDLTSHPLLSLMALTEECQLDKLHGVLCFCFASLLEHCSSWVISEAFKPEGTVASYGSLSSVISSKSAVGIMAHTSTPGIQRLLKVWSRLELRCTNYHDTCYNAYVIIECMDLDLSAGLSILGEHPFVARCSNRLRATVALRDRAV